MYQAILYSNRYTDSGRIFFFIFSFFPLINFILLIFFVTNVYINNVVHYQVTYTYRQKTIEGLERAFAQALHQITEAEFERFAWKNTLSIIAGGAICLEDANVANKTAFMFCVQKVWI